MIFINATCPACILYGGSFTLLGTLGTAKTVAS